MDWEFVMFGTDFCVWRSEQTRIEVYVAFLRGIMLHSRLLGPWIGDLVLQVLRLDISWLPAAVDCFCSSVDRIIYTLHFGVVAGVQWCSVYFGTKP